MLSKTGLLAWIIKVHKYICPDLVSIGNLEVADLKRMLAMSRDAESRFFKVFSSSPNMVAITTLRNGRFIDINESFTRFTGYTRSDVIGRNVFDIGIWANVGERKRILQELKLNKRVYNQEINLVYKDGEKRTCLFSAELLVFEDTPCMISVATDITERKLDEEALRISEEFSNSLLENAPNPITVINPDGSIKYVNPAFEKLTGFVAADVVGNMMPYPWWPPERQKIRMDGLKRFMAGGEAMTEQTIQTREGERLLVELNMVRVVHNGDFKYYLAHWKDITERRKAEDAMLRERNRAQNYLNVAGTMVLALDTAGNVELINARGCEILGRQEDEIIGKNWFDCFLPADSGPGIKETFKRVMKGETEVTEHLINPLLTKDGRQRLIAWHNTVITDEFGRITGALSSGDDITSLKLAQDALQESEERYRDLFENTSELIQSVTPDGRFRYVNYGWKSTLGYDDADIARLTIFDIIHPDYLEHYRALFGQLMAGEEIGPVDVAFISKSGSKVIVEGNVTCKFEDGHPVHTRGIFHNVTRRKYLERDVSRLASAVSMSTDCIIITDFDARIIDVNQKTIEAYGAANKEEMLGMHFLELIDPAARGAANMDVKTIIENGSLDNREYVMVSREGRRFVVRMATSLVKDAEGQPMGIVRVGREIGQSRRYNNTLLAGKTAG